MLGVKLKKHKYHFERKKILRYRFVSFTIQKKKKIVS